MVQTQYETAFTYLPKHRYLQRLEDRRVQPRQRKDIAANVSKSQQIVIHPLPLWYAADWTTQVQSKLSPDEFHIARELGDHSEPNGLSMTNLAPPSQDQVDRNDSGIPYHHLSAWNYMIPPPLTCRRFDHRSGDHDSGTIHGTLHLKRFIIFARDTFDVCGDSVRAVLSDKSRCSIHVELDARKSRRFLT